MDQYVSTRNSIALGHSDIGKTDIGEALGLPAGRALEVDVGILMYVGLGIVPAKGKPRCAAVIGHRVYQPFFKKTLQHPIQGNSVGPFSDPAFQVGLAQGIICTHKGLQHRASGCRNPQAVGLQQLADVGCGAGQLILGWALRGDAVITQLKWQSPGADGRLKSICARAVR